MDEKLTIPGLSDDDERTVNRLNAKLNESQPRNMLRASLYDGKHAIRQVGTIIPPQYYRLGIVLGWSAKAVDMLARRCNPDRFVWPDGDLNSLGYGEMADTNHLVAQIKSGIVSSLIHGPSFLINTVGDESAGEAKSLIHVKDAMNATGDWNARKHALDNLYSVTRRDDEGKVTGFVLYLDGVNIVATKDGKWSFEAKPHGFGVPAEAMVYKPRVGREFGSSRISRPIISIHERAVRSAIRMDAHMDVYSIAQMVLLGADESIFKNPDGSTKASWQIALGRVFGIPDDPDAENPRADVKQFQAQSPEPHIATIKQLAMEFSGEASIPLTSLGVSDQSNPTSADSYIASREDLIAEAEGATDDWSTPLKRSIARALAIQNDLSAVPREFASIQPKWRSPIHLSRAAQADAGTKQLSAVPWLADTEVGLELLGLDDQQIKRAMADRRRVAGRQLLNQIVPPSTTQPAPPNGSVG